MTPQRRTALVSVLVAIALIGLKLGTGLATHSLGLISEAAHSGTDLVAALLTFFAVGVAFQRFDMDDDVCFRKRRLHGPLDRIRRRMALADGGVVGDTDDDVGEMAAGSLAHAQAA